MSEHQLTGCLPERLKNLQRTTAQGHPPPVFAFLCQMGVRISSTSALRTSKTGILPMWGKARRLRPVPLCGPPSACVADAEIPGDQLADFNIPGGRNPKRLLRGTW